MLYHIGAFIGGSDLCLTVTEAGTGLSDLFTYYMPPIVEYNEAAH